MFGWEFPPHISGGLGTACHGLTSGLLDHGVDVTFVVPHLNGDEDKQKFRLMDAGKIEIDLNNPLLQEKLERLTYISVNSGIIPYMDPETFTMINQENGNSTFRQYDKMSFGMSGIYGRDLMKEVSEYAIVASQIASEFAHDIIHAHDWLTFPAGVEAKLISGKPLVVHVHATEFDRSGDQINPTVYEVEKRGMEMADLIIVVSAYTGKILTDRYGIEPGKIRVVHNAVIQNKQHPTHARNEKGSKKTVTFLGRVTFQKGPDYFIEAAEKILRKFPDTRFVMAGSGDMLKGIVRKTAEMRIGSRFHFTGFLEGEETEIMYEMSDVYVMPSVSEPFGITTLEAIRSGVPVVISKQSGVSEILSHAIKVDFWDTDALADAVCGLMNHKSLHDISVRENSKDIKNIVWKHSAKKVKDIYHALTPSKNKLQE